MTPTSPTTTTTSTRPPARNKSSSALSTQTLRSLSSTTSSTGGGPPKPRRNKSSSALSSHGAHHHSAGHHPVSFAHHRKNSFHGHAAPHGLKRSGSVSGSARRGSAGGGGGFGLGMTSMTSLPPAGGRGDDDQGEYGGEGEREGEDATRPRRPKLEGRRSSSSSTATVVASERGRERGRDRSRSRARQEEEEAAEAERRRRDEEIRRRAAQAQAQQQQQQQQDDEEGETPVKPNLKQRISGSVTSTNSEWASETDSPLAIGKKLPPVDRAHQQPEGRGGLAQAFDDHPEQAAVPPRANGKKAQFSLGASEDQEEEEDGDEDEVDEAGDGVIPPAAMPPAETPALPAMPAVLEAVSQEASPQEIKPSSEEIAAAASSTLPPPTRSPQHLSPPDEPAGEEISPGEPSLAAAAQPEFAYPNNNNEKPPSPPSSRPASKPPSLSPNAPPQNPPPASRLDPSTNGQAPPSPLRPTPQRVAAPTPVRKSSDASIMSLSRASMRSHLTATTAQHRAPQFRRTASGVAPTVVDRAAMGRAELASPMPPPSGERAEKQRGEGGSRREDRPRSSSRQGGSAAHSHSRTESMSSLRSLRQAAEATTAPNRRANTLGPADAKRLKATETAGGALAALGNIAAMSSAAGVRSPAPTAAAGGGSGSGRSGDGSEEEGALTHAKRSASGYFNALRGIAGLQALSSTPPLSPSANAAQRYPIPGATSRDRSTSSYARGGGAGAGMRARSSPSPVNPPLIVKFAEPPPPPPQPAPPRPSSPPASSAALPSSPAPHGRFTSISRTASSASLHAPLSRTQQKALLARDAPSSSSTTNPSHAPSPSPAAGAQNGAGTGNGMQKWAFGLIKEAERIERQYRAVERWRDPMGEGLERVLGKIEADKRVRKERRVTGGGDEGAGEGALVVPQAAGRGKQRALTTA